MPTQAISFPGTELMKLVQENGPFAAGVFVGWAITERATSVVREEWEKERKAHREREAILQGQIEKKEQRIDALHEKLSKLSETAATQSKEKKT